MNLILKQTIRFFSVIAIIFILFLMYIFVSELNYSKKVIDYTAKSELKIMYVIVSKAENIKNLNHELINTYNFNKINNKSLLGYYKRSPNNEKIFYWIMVNHHDQKIKNFVVAYSKLTDLVYFTLSGSYVSISISENDNVLDKIISILNKKIENQERIRGYSR